MPSSDARLRILHAHAELSARYRETLADEVGFFRGACIEDPSQAALLRHRAHRIRGAAGSFGLPELSRLAADVELAPTQQAFDRARWRLVAALEALFVPERESA